jgi:hypothetical protein
MHMVHSISLSNVKEAANLEEFIDLCCLMPIPAAKWMKLMKHRRQIEQFLLFGSKLSRKITKIFKVYFERYQESSRKLLMSDIIKRAVKGPPACQKVTHISNLKTEPTTNTMKDNASVDTQLLTHRKTEPTTNTMKDNASVDNQLLTLEHIVNQV